MKPESAAPRSSPIVPAYFDSALSKLREGAVDKTTHSAPQGQFAHDVDHGLWTFVGATEALFQQVQRLFRKLDQGVFLRAIDALHLVTAGAERLDQGRRPPGSRESDAGR